MKNLEKAKERAENYLYRIIEQNWDSFVKNGIPVLIKSVGRPPRTIRIKMEPVDHFELMNWPLRFEAYSYLGNKYRKKIRNFAIELRELWNEWIELSKKGLFGSKEIFWSTENEALNTINLDRKKTRFPGSQIESHISMFRAKEILEIGGLEIGGYEPYFNKAKKRIRDALTSKPGLSLSGPLIESFESFVRSPLLKSKISDYLRAIARKLSEDEELVFDPFLTAYDYAKIAFLLCFGNFGSDLFNSAKRVMLDLIDEQAKNGSFKNNLNTTCLCASAIHYMKLDPSNSICSKAIDYILKEQNKEGYWDFFSARFSLIGYRRYSTDWNVLSTVIVLETLDLITNDKPLPIWALEAEPEDISRLHKHPRIQIDKPLSAPGGINWSDVSIWFISPERVEVRAGIPLGVVNFIRMGFKDGRIKKPDLYKPDLSWAALRTFAKLNEEISWKDKGVEEKVRNSLKSCVKVIRKRLQFLFGIQSDPFHPYDRGERSYRTRFKISSREDNQD